MRFIKLAVFAVFFLGCKVQCGSRPPELATAADGGPSALCAHLNAIGCLQLANCVATVTKIETSRTTDLKESQLMAATSKEEAEAIGTVTCAP